MKSFIYFILVLLISGCISPANAVGPDTSNISLRETVRSSAMRDLRSGPVLITGKVSDSGITQVQIRVTTSLGRTDKIQTPVKNGEFKCRYPSDFGKSPALAPGMIFIDASDNPDFDVSKAGYNQAEAAVLVYDSKQKLIPDMPTGFTTDLLDKKGNKDQASSEWPAVHTLINLYMRSKGAKFAHVGKPDFDLANPADMAYFKNSLALYDFDYRDRDWSTPLNNRVARNYWQSVWDTWFNSSNDHPLDGNKNNNAPSNFLPYAFSNDYSDILIMYLMRQHGVKTLDDNLTAMCREGTANLLAMQHKDPSNFALTDVRGKRENYTAGAFRYGMFENGELMSEGKGWFYNPAFLDYIAGGVLNGRCVWAMGESLKADPKGPLANQLKSAIALTIKFCLSDALDSGYAHKTPQGNVYWRDAGEHAYLVIGMVAACSVAPDYIVLRPEGGKPVTLRQACVSALNALVDLKQPHNQWAIYPNTDSMAIAALADGVDVLRSHPDVAKWRKTASDVADAWMNAKVPASEFHSQPVHFGLRLAPNEMTYNWSRIAPDGWKNRNFFFYYQTGHWIHALGRLYAVTGDPKYRIRAGAMVSYLCGDNPFGVRLLNEIGGVYNWVEDSDGDGVEDYMKQDMYPESTAFTQIGIMHLMNSIVNVSKPKQ